MGRKTTNSPKAGRQVGLPDVLTPVRARIVPILLSVCCLLAGAQDSACAKGDLDLLVAEYESLLDRHDDRSYREQSRVLTEIADLRTGSSQMRLRKMLERHAKVDRVRTTHLMRAVLRYGTAKDIDDIIRDVERRRDDLLRETLSSMLAETRRPSAQKHLRKDVLKRAAPPIRVQVVRAIGLIGGEEAVFVLLPLLREQPLEVLVETLGALGVLKDVRALRMVALFTKHHDARIRDAAARALGMIGDSDALPVLRKALDDEDTRVLESAATAIGLIGDPESIQLLIDKLKAVVDENLRLADAFANALHRITGKPLGTDPEHWQQWWNVARDKPFTKLSEEGPNATVAGVRYYDIPVRSSRVTFVLDISRSMGWNQRLDSAQRELNKAIEKLPRRTKFNVLVFSDEVGAFKPRLTEAKPGTVKRAGTYISRQRPLNGTNTFDALRIAFDDDGVDTIYFLSDGHPSVGPIVDTELILASVRKWNRYRRVRIHCIALMRGEPPQAYAGRENVEQATHFMRELAKQNDGVFVNIR